MVQQGDATITKIANVDNFAIPFTKALPSKVFDYHLDSLGLRCNTSWLWVQVEVCWDCALKPMSFCIRHCNYYLHLWKSALYIIVYVYVS